MKNKQLVALFTTLALCFTAMQGVIPTLPLHSHIVVSILAAGALFLTVVFTALKQWASDEVSNKSLYYTGALTVLVILHALNDFLKVVPFSPDVSQWISIGISVLVMVLNISSRVLFPDDTGSQVVGSSLS